jgi:hypothetical protein
MAHLWQHHFGKPSRTTYHNKEWAAKMHQVGLIPTSTGWPGGKETGQHVTHIIEEGGPFEVVCAELMSEGYGVAWVENTPGGAGSEGEDEGGEGEEAPKPKNKIKYTCPGCGLNAWGKPDLWLVCGEDSERLQAAA